MLTRCVCCAFALHVADLNDKDLLPRPKHARSLTSMISFMWRRSAPLTIETLRTLKNLIAVAPILECQLSNVTNEVEIDEIAKLVDTFSTTTFSAVQVCSRGSLETLKARVAAMSLSNMTSTGAKMDPMLDAIQTRLMISIISYLGGLLETDAFKANNTIDIPGAAHETAPDLSSTNARSSTTGAFLVAMAPAPLPGRLAVLGLLCAVLYSAVQAFAAHLGALGLASIPGPPPTEGRRAVSATSPSCRPSARRGSVGRLGSAPRTGVLFLTLMVGFASAQTPPPSPPSRPPAQPPRPAQRGTERSCSPAFPSLAGLCARPPARRPPDGVRTAQLLGTRASGLCRHAQAGPREARTRSQSCALAAGVLLEQRDRMPSPAQTSGKDGERATGQQ